MIVFARGSARMSSRECATEAKSARDIERGRERVGERKRA